MWYDRDRDHEPQRWRVFWYNGTWYIARGVREFAGPFPSETDAAIECGGRNDRERALWVLSR